MYNFVEVLVLEIQVKYSKKGSINELLLLINKSIIHWHFNKIKLYDKFINILQIIIEIKTTLYSTLKIN